MFTCNPALPWPEPGRYDPRPPVPTTLQPPLTLPWRGPCGPTPWFDPDDEWHPLPLRSPTNFPSWAEPPAIHVNRATSARRGGTEEEPEAG